MATLLTPEARRCFPLFAQMVDAQEGTSLAEHGAALDAALAAADAVAADGLGHDVFLALQAAFRAGAAWAEWRAPAFLDSAALRNACMHLDDLLAARVRLLAAETEIIERRPAA